MGEPERASGIYNMMMGSGFGSSTLHREQEDTFHSCMCNILVLYANGEVLWGR